MKLIVNEDAARWYKEELALEDGDFLRFFAQVYGTSIHPNYSLGITRKPPQNMAIHTNVEGITFYFDEADAWFLDNHSLTVALQGDDIDFRFTEDSSDSQ